MMVKPGHQHVDSSGRCYFPYLSNWRKEASNMIGLINEMIRAFSLDPPVRERPTLPSSSPSPSPSPPPLVSSSSFSMSHPHLRPPSGGSSPPPPSHPPPPSYHPPPHPPPSFHHPPPSSYHPHQPLSSFHQPPAYSALTSMSTPNVYAGFNPEPMPHSYSQSLSTLKPREPAPPSRPNRRGDVQRRLEQRLQGLPEEIGREGEQEQADRSSAQQRQQHLAQNCSDLEQEIDRAKRELAHLDSEIAGMKNYIAANGSAVFDPDQVIVSKIGRAHV